MTDSHPLLSVVVPAYNEAERLGGTLREILAHLRHRGTPWELIVVDDGSSDATAAVAERAGGGELRLIRIGPNRGKGHAVRVGVLASLGRAVLVCDADGATPIAELDRLDAELTRGAAVAIGSRHRARIGVRQSPLREALGRAGNAAIRALLLPGITDTQCGFKLYDGAAARRVLGLVRTDGWGFDIEVLYLFRAAGARIAEVPVRWNHRPGGTLRPTAYLTAGLELLRLCLRYRTGRRASPDRPPAPTPEPTKLRAVA